MEIPDINNDYTRFSKVMNSFSSSWGQIQNFLPLLVEEKKVCYWFFFLREIYYEIKQFLDKFEDKKMEI